MDAIAPDENRSTDDDPRSRRDLERAVNFIARTESLEDLDDLGGIRRVAADAKWTP